MEKNKKKIAIDSGPLTSGHKVRGIGAHTSELLRTLKIPGVDFSKADLSKFDVLHYTSFHPFFISLPWQKPRNTKIVLTIHDLIPLIYPKHYPGGIKGGIRLAINKFLIRKNVDAIITISETSKKDICRFLGVHPDKVHVVYLAPRKIFKKLKIGSVSKNGENLKLKIAKKYGLPDFFALYVGDVNYNKNIPTLIKACKLTKIPLVICGKQALEIETLGREDLTMLKGPKDWIRYLFGKPHPELAHFQDLLKEFNHGKSVIRLGFVPDEDLVAIYNLASVYVQPSFYEGFSLPILEALACGTPVVASKIQVHVEIAGRAVTFADPNDPKDFVRAIETPVRGRKLPRKYSWEKTAKETLEVYAKI